MQDRSAQIRAKMQADRSAGERRTLVDYAAQFPDDDVSVARAFASVHADPDAPATRGPRGGAEPDCVGPYRILSELGRGGQGSVHLAEDLRLHRKVALKLLTGLGPGSEDAARRFRREAEVASKLAHPNICAVYDAGVADGVPYIAMQYVEGETLAARIAAARSDATVGESSSLELRSETGGDAEPSPAPAPSRTGATPEAVRGHLRVFAQLARALHAAHEAGVVHRDVKPGNVMIATDGRPVILDFGLARADREDVSLTRTGDLFGTPAYMSPEQLTGQRIRLDRRSDVYSLGVALYECLTLKRPFEAPTREALYQAILTKAPPDPRRATPAVSADLRVVVETALEKDRDRRYATAEAFAQDLEAVLDGRPIAARAVGPLGRFARWAKREPAKAALLAVVLAAFPTIAALATAHWKDLPRLAAARAAEIERRRDEWLAEAGFEATEGDVAKAVALYERALAAEGPSPEAAGGLVLCQLKLGNAGEALRLLDKHRALLGDGAAAHLLRADALRASGRAAEAKAVDAAAPPPSAAFEHHLIAQKELQKGEDGDEAAFRRAKHHVDAAILLSSAPRLSLIALRAHLAGHLLDRDAAVESADALQARWPDLPQTQTWIAFALSDLGDDALSRRAEAALVAAVRLRPDDVDLHRKLGLFHLARDSHDAAAAAFREALRLAPPPKAAEGAAAEDPTLAGLKEWARASNGHAVAYRNLGIELTRRGRMDEAVEALREAVRLQPGSAAAHATLGAALTDRAIATNGAFGDGVRALREAIRLSPSEAKLYCNLAVAYTGTGYLDEAAANYRTALAADPTLAVARCNLGLILLRSRRPREALVELRRGDELGRSVAGWPYPSAEWIQRAEKAVKDADAAEALLARADAAGAPPADPDDLLAAATAAAAKNRHALAASWFRDAFEELPDAESDSEAGYRRLAARAAVLAATEPPPSAGSPAPDDAARAAWRAQAAAWLEAEVAELRQALNAGDRPPTHVRFVLSGLQKSADFRAVRDPAATANLPSVEAARWAKLWSDAAALLASIAPDFEMP